MNLAASIQTLAPYIPGETAAELAARLGLPPESIVHLDANENPYGPSRRARRALARLHDLHRYPDPSYRVLRRALAQFSGAPPENLLVGNGSDELLGLMMEALLDPGDCVIACPPTFSMYAFYARRCGAQMIEIPRRADFSLDLTAICQAVESRRPKALFTATPNNPDGRPLADEEIETLLALPVLVVLDEAYIEFSGLGRLGNNGTRIRQVSERENLAVLRTFSKWAGLAGLRVGYGAFPGWLAAALWKAKSPYNVSAAAEAAVLASLEDLDDLAGKVERLIAGRERVSRGLARFPGIRVYPSRANFVLCQVDAAAFGRPAAQVYTALKAQGILTRWFDTPLLNDCLRISVGKARQNALLLDKMMI